MGMGPPAVDKKTRWLNESIREDRPLVFFDESVIGVKKSQA